MMSGWDEVVTFWTNIDPESPHPRMSAYGRQSQLFNSSIFGVLDFPDLELHEDAIGTHVTMDD